MDYFEETLSLALIQKLYEWHPLTPAIALEINADAKWDDVQRDAKEIGYPTAD